MGSIIEKYFRSIYTTSNPSDFDDILNEIHPATSDEATGMLGRDFHQFHVDEVQLALKQMDPLTALGPDGMSPMFYKSF